VGSNAGSGREALDNNSIYVSIIVDDIDTTTMGEWGKYVLWEGGYYSYRGG
jgi:hypothetical protein